MDTVEINVDFSGIPQDDFAKLLKSATSEWPFTPEQTREVIDHLTKSQVDFSKSLREIDIDYDKLADRVETLEEFLRVALVPNERQAHIRRSQGGN